VSSFFSLDAASAGKELLEDGSNSFAGVARRIAGSASIEVERELRVTRTAVIF